VIAQRIWNIKSDWHNAISQATFVQWKYLHVEQYCSSLCRLDRELKIIRKSEVLQMKLTFLRQTIIDLNTCPAFGVNSRCSSGYKSHNRRQWHNSAGEYSTIVCIFIPQPLRKRVMG
jgi:hypothetical protein